MRSLKEGLDVLSMMQHANDLNGARGETIKDSMRVYEGGAQTGDQFVPGPAKLGIVEESLASTP
jgi:hypothetical protein